MWNIKNIAHINVELVWAINTIPAISNLPNHPSFHASKIFATIHHAPFLSTIPDNI
jgi:hypothetical protein